MTECIRIVINKKGIKYNGYLFSDKIILDTSIRLNIIDIDILDKTNYLCQENHVSYAFEDINFVYNLNIEICIDPTILNHLMNNTKINRIHVYELSQELCFNAKVINVYLNNVKEHIQTHGKFNKIIYFIDNSSATIEINKCNKCHINIRNSTIEIIKYYMCDELRLRLKGDGGFNTISAGGNISYLELINFNSFTNFLINFDYSLLKKISFGITKPINELDDMQLHILNNILRSIEYIIYLQDDLTIMDDYTRVITSKHNHSSETLNKLEGVIYTRIGQRNKSAYK